MHQNVKFEVWGHFFEHATFQTSVHFSHCKHSRQPCQMAHSYSVYVLLLTLSIPSLNLPHHLCKQDASHNGQSIHHLKTKWVSFSISSREPIVTRPHLHDHTMLSVHCKTFWLQNPQNLKCYPFSQSLRINYDSLNIYSIALVCVISLLTNT